jgi:polyhydroxybutyrate depolymerase
MTTRRKAPIIAAAIFVLLTAAALIFFAATFGLFWPSRASAQTTSATIQVGSLERKYLIHLPPLAATSGTATATIAPVPLIIVLHGATEQPAGIEHLSKMSELADAHNFIAVYPEGTSAHGLAPTWNAGNCCGYAQENKIDDVAFIRALIDKLKTGPPPGYAIDPKRIYATGISNGGMLSYRLACELSDQIAAIAPVEGAQYPDCHPTHPVSVIIFHGTADHLVPFDGGTSPFQVGPHRSDIPVREAFAFWVHHDGCYLQPTHEETAELHTTIYSSCNAGSADALYAIQGGHHMWPGVLPSGNSVPASDLIYSFFIAHPKQ